MMKAMRENTKIILWVVVVAFLITIFAVWGLDLQTGSVNRQQNSVGSVDGVDITPQTYQSVYNQLAEQYRSGNASGDLSAPQREMLRQQAWDNIVNNILTGREIQRLGITVTDAEVLSFIRSSPPPEIQQYFQDEQGNFDFAAYQQALNNPDADWTSVEALVRQRVPVLKLNQYLMSQVHVSQAEITRALQEENVKLVAEYVAFPVESEPIEGTGPTDDKVAAYYESHLDQFQNPEKAVLEVVRIPLAPTATDRANLEYSAEQVRADALKGDFAAVAKAFSETHTAQVGGETGFVSGAQRDPAVIAALQTMQPGATSSVIGTRDGVAIVQLIATKKEKGETLYNFREIVMKLAAGSATIDSFSTIAQDLHQHAATSGDLATAAKNAGLDVTISEPFAKGMPVPGVGYVPALSRFAFAGEIGEVSPVTSDEKNLYVARIKNRTPAAARPLEEVAEGIKATLTREAKTEAAKRKARSFMLTAAKPDIPLRTSAAQYGYQVVKTDSFTVASPVAGLAPYSAFARAALVGRVGETVGPVVSGNTVYVIAIVGRFDPQPEVLAAKIPETRNRLYQQKTQSYIAYWINQLKESSKIEDLREASS
jgi:peptidyl-prolyl cis-trans isomerase D